MLLQCKNCEYKTQSIKEFELHVASECSTYKCEFCHDCLVSATSLKRHLAGRKGLSEQCSGCGLLFCANHEYTRHRKYCKKNYSELCNMCQTTFTCPNAFAAHSKGTREEDWICATCKFTFCTKNRLKKHLSSMERENVKCEACDRVFCFRDRFTRHLRYCNASQISEHLNPTTNIESNVSTVPYVKRKRKRKLQIPSDDTGIPIKNRPLDEATEAIKNSPLDEATEAIKNSPLDEATEAIKNSPLDEATEAIKNSPLDEASENDREQHHTSRHHMDQIVQLPISDSQPNIDQIEVLPNMSDENETPVSPVYTLTGNQYSHPRSIKKPHKQVICKICRSSFTRDGHLRVHIKKRVQSILKCTKCRRLFCYIRKYTKHIKTCTGEFIEKCVSCDNEFHSRESLEDHEKICETIKTCPDVRIKNNDKKPRKRHTMPQNTLSLKLPQSISSTIEPLSSSSDAVGESKDASSVAVKGASSVAVRGASSVAVGESRGASLVDVGESRGASLVDVGESRGDTSRSVVIDMTCADEATYDPGPNTMKNVRATCVKCGSMFSTVEKLKKHQKEGQSEVIKCRGCQYKFCVKKDYTKHLGFCINSYKKKCKRCKETYMSRKAFMEHNHQCYPGQRICNSCGLVIFSNAKYNNHMRLKRKVPIKCEYCENIFCIESKFRYHYPFCSSSKLQQMEILEAHTKSLSLGKEHIIPKHQCSVCQTRFVNKSFLNRHCRDREKITECEKCRRLFCFSSEHAKHVRKCNGHFTGNCFVCGTEFYSRHDFDVHQNICQKVRVPREIRIIEKDIIDSPVIAKKRRASKKVVNSFKSLDEHSPVIAEITSAPNDTVTRSSSQDKATTKPCPYCYETFDNGDDCKSHIKLHGRELFTKEFVRPVNELTSKGENECYVCGYRTVDRDIMRIHLEFWHYTDMEKNK